MSFQTTVSVRRTGFRDVFLETVVVAMAGVVFAFAVNQLSPRGLNLTRNYFPAGTNVSVPLPAIAEPPRAVAATNLAVTPPTLIVVPRLAEKSLQGIDTRQATLFFHDPRRQQELVVFVDARNDQLYQQGHIPGAYQFDPYRPQNYLAAVIPVCQAAEQVVVYCTGSDCEDSELAAILLRDTSITNQKLFVYVGGITEWTASNLPVEIGARKSGNLRNANK